MRKVKNVWKLFLTLTLSVAMLVSEIPMTAFATSTEIVNDSEKEVTEEQTQTEAIREEDALGEQTEEISKEEATEKDSEDEESSKEEATEKDSEDEKGSEEKTTEEGLEDEESSEAETIEESEESLEEVLLSSDADFVISGGVLTGYTGTDADVVIPEGVVTIGSNVFQGNTTIKKITFSSTVTTINASAFQGCSSLAVVELNDGLVTIGDFAFREARFGEELPTGKVECKKLTIPSTVQSIGKGAFYHCTYLEEIKFENGVNEKLEISNADSLYYYNVFGDCANLKKVNLPDRLEMIPSHAFAGCTGLVTVEFGNRLTTIEKYAFSGCSSLSEVTLNEGLVTIGDFAFQGVGFGEELPTGKVECKKLTIPSTVQSIGRGAFYSCTYLEEIEFQNGENSILEIYGLANSSIQSVFGRCDNLKKVTFPNRLETIPSYAFAYCTNLVTVEFGNRLKTIKEGAFQHCSSLAGIDLPDKVETVEKFAFHGCGSLSEVTLNEGLVTIGEYAFLEAGFGEELPTGKVEYKKLTIPSTVRSIGAAAFNHCTYLEEIEFKNGTNEILELNSNAAASNHSVFGRCENLKKVTFPDRLETIPSYAFADCTNLVTVEFGNGLKTIKEGAFQNCSSLSGIDLPDKVETVEQYAFHGCSSLSEVMLNEGLVTIGDYAFQKAGFGKELSTGKVEYGTLTIPSTVRSIGIGAFYKCTYLENVIFANDYIEVLTISKSGGAWCSPFGECPALKTVILPERLTQLQAYTFANNSALTKLYIPETVTTIDPNAIFNCPKLTIYGISGSMAETYAKQNNIPFKSKDDLDIGLKVQSVTLTPSFIKEIGEDSIGKKIQLNAEVLPDTAQNKEVVYKSDNEAVVTVNKDGLVTINGYGETTITVTTVDGNKSAKCEVAILKGAIDDRPLINTVLFPKNTTAYSAIYTGEQIRPVMTVSYQYKDDKGSTKTQKLNLNVDYTVSYRNNVNAGENTAEVTVRGIGEYNGEITKKFTITPKDIQGVALSPVGDIVFGEEPSLVVTDGTYELIKGRDYNVVLSTPGSEGADTQSVLTVKGIRNYTGTSKKSVTFNILKKGTNIQSIESATNVALKLSAKGYTYSGKAQKPSVVVTDKSTGRKVAASNYKVLYTNNINAGTANVQVVGVSKNGEGYYGISQLSFEIKPKDFNKVNASIKGTIPKAGTIKDIQKAIDEALTVKDGKHILSESEYTVDYGNITNADDIKIGTKYPITLKAKADGNYTKNSQKVVYIKFGQLNLASKTANVSVRITDAGQNEIILSYNGVRLVKGRDYTAVVTKDKKKDTYTVKIKAVKNSAYKGSRTIKNLTI